METNSLNLKNLLMAAKAQKASDLHITVGVKPKLRVNGDLTELETFGIIDEVSSATLVDSMITRQQKTVLEEQGELDFAYAVDGLGRYRVNIFKQKGFYAAVLRVIENEIPAAESLGLPKSVLELANKRRGLVLVTGPTGSGKSTTLASLIDIINTTRDAHIVTLEDPIEYVHEHKKAIVNQREIGIDTQSYTNGLRAALREDPDVILVGEMRDLDTISTAITAAETGHLVFSTLHTIGAAPTIDRIIDVFPPHQQNQIRIELASVLESVISQQLMPTSDGNGRVAAFEVMHGSTSIKSLIREGKIHQIESYIQTSKNIGMQTMDDAILDLYRKNKISGEVATEFAVDSVEMSKMLY